MPGRGAIGRCLDRLNGIWDTAVHQEHEVINMSLENAVLKIARQIRAYDEASLMSLWEQLAERVAHFEPTARWEDAVVALSIVQGVRMKNQLFNHHMSHTAKAPAGPGMRIADLTIPEGMERTGFEELSGEAGQLNLDAGESESDGSDVGSKRGKLLEFKPRQK